LKLEPGNKKPNVHIIDFGLSRKYKTKDGELTEVLNFFQKKIF